MDHDADDLEGLLEWVWLVSLDDEGFPPYSVRDTSDVE